MRQLEGTMMMDTDWPFIDWVNDVWPLGPVDTVEAMLGVVLCFWIAAWWGMWDDDIWLKTVLRRGRKGE